MEDELGKTRSHVCSKCQHSFTYTPEKDTWWDEKGYGYSTQLCKCSVCGSINVLKHVEDYGFSKMNTDRRLYYSNK